MGIDECCTLREIGGCKRGEDVNIGGKREGLKCSNEGTLSLVRDTCGSSSDIR